MKCAKAPNQFAAIDPDDVTIRKTFAQDRECGFIGRIGERRRKHAGICDVEVRIASRQPQAFAHDLLRHWQRNDFNRATVNFHCLQAREIFLKWLVIFVVTIFFDDRHNRSFGNKTREIVDVAIGIVAGDAVAKPENIANSQIIPQALLDLLARQIWISILV